MAGWLAKATKALGQTSDSAPVSFELECACHAMITGVRRNVYQRAICKECGESFFILPIDVYPAPKSKKKSSQRKSRRSTSSARTSSTHDESTSPKAKESTSASSASRHIPAQNLKKLFTPFRLVVIAIVVLVSLTGFWIVERRGIEQAEVELKVASDRAYAALKADDLQAAADQFRLAVDALNILERDDTKSRELRLMARELNAAVHLAPASLSQILEEAQEKWISGGEDELDLHLKLNYRDQWIVIETSVFKDVAPDGKSRIVIDYPLMVGNQLVTIDGDLHVLEQLEFGEEPLTVVFAAQISDCRPSAANTNRWTVRLQDETAFLWANYENYRRIGFDPFDDQAANRLREVLQQQAEMSGIVQ